MEDYYSATFTFFFGSYRLSKFLNKNVKGNVTTFTEMKTLKQNLLPPKRKKALAIHSTFPTFRKYARCVSLLKLKYIIGFLPPTLRPRSSTSTASCGRDHITDIITCHMDNFITIHTFRFFSIERRPLNASLSNYCPTQTTSAHPRRCDFKRCRFVFQNPRPMLSAGEEE